jgi:hypothetical protein
VSHSSSGDRRVPCLRKSSTVWIWQHDRRTDDYKIILNLRKKIDKNRPGKAQSLKKVTVGQKSENRRNIRKMNVRIVNGNTQKFSFIRVDEKFRILICQWII